MAHVTGDRVKDTTTTTGTGDITVSGTAPTGFRTLSTVATADGDTCFIAIVGGAEWETSLATRVSANVYTRTTILESSNSNAAVNFSAGTKDVFITLPASKIADNTAYASTWDGDTATAPSKNAVYDVLQGYVPPDYIAANWRAISLPPFGASAAFGAALSVNVIYYHPFFVPRAVTLSDLGARVVTASAGGNFALAIYAHNASTGRPTGNVLAATGNMSTTSTGVVTADITGANVTLQPGIYWAAVWQDNASAAFTVITSSFPSLMATMIGSATVANVLSGTGGSNLCLSSIETYNASAWPNATSESYFENAAETRCAVLLGKSA